MPLNGLTPSYLYRDTRRRTPTHGSATEHFADVALSDGLNVSRLYSDPPPGSFFHALGMFQHGELWITIAVPSASFFARGERFESSADANFPMSLNYVCSVLKRATVL